MNDDRSRSLSAMRIVLVTAVAFLALSLVKLSGVYEEIFSKAGWFVVIIGTGGIVITYLLGSVGPGGSATRRKDGDGREESEKETMHPYVQYFVMSVIVLVVVAFIIETLRISDAMPQAWQSRVLAVGVGIAIIVGFAVRVGLRFPGAAKNEVQVSREGLTTSSAFRTFVYGIVGGAFVIGSLGLWYTAEHGEVDAVDVLLIGSVLVLLALLLALIYWLTKR